MNIKYLTPEAQAKFDHLTNVKASAECAMGAIMNDPKSFEVEEMPTSPTSDQSEWMGEMKAEPTTARRFFSPPKENVDNSFMVKRRMESMSEIRYEARKYPADHGMFTIVKVSQIAVAIAYDEEEAEAIVKALVAAQYE